jgi:hypothetical protein
MYLLKFQNNDVYLNLIADLANIQSLIAFIGHNSLFLLIKFIYSFLILFPFLICVLIVIIFVFLLKLISFIVIRESSAIRAAEKDTNNALAFVYISYYEVNYMFLM